MTGKFRGVYPFQHLTVNRVRNINSVWRTCTWVGVRTERFFDGLHDIPGEGANDAGGREWTFITLRGLKRRELVRRSIWFNVTKTWAKSDDKVETSEKE